MLWVIHRSKFQQITANAKDSIFTSVQALYVPFLTEVGRGEASSKFCILMKKSRRNLGNCIEKYMNV